MSLTAYVHRKGRPGYAVVEYDLGPAIEDREGVKIGWYRNEFQPQPIGANWNTAAVQVGTGQSGQFDGGSYVNDTLISTPEIAVPDSMKNPAIPPRTLEHGKSYVVFYGAAAAGVVATRTLNTLVVGAGHAFLNGQWVTLTTTGTLPAGLLANTLYYVVSRTSTEISLSLTPGGSAITLSSDGTGVHTVVPFVKVARFDEADQPDISNVKPLGMY